MGREILRGRAVNLTPGNCDGIDRAQAERALALLCDPEHRVELRPLPSARSVILPGADLAGLLDAADAAERQGNTVYLVLNPVDPPEGTKSCRDAHAARRAWLFFDVDPLRAAGFDRDSATDLEKAAAGALASSLATWLAEDQGWPLPVQVDSGNGYYLWYLIDLPNDPAAKALVRALTKALKARFDNATAVIDGSVTNAARLAKLPGTLSRKGPGTAERPHRRCRIINAPVALEAVPSEAMQALADDAAAPEAAPTEAPRRSPLSGRAFSGGRAAYGKKALAEEAGRVFLAIPGPREGRNNALNRAAFALGQLVAGGVLSRAEVESALMGAALAAGLDETEAERTVRSGIEAGMAQPRGVPTGGGTDRNGAASTPPLAAESPHVKGAVDATPEAWWEFTFGDEMVAEGTPDEVREAVAGAAPAAAEANVRRFEVLTIGELMARDYPEPEWVIKGVMSEGLNILAGAPKQGKSMLALNVALTVAGGGKALDDVQVNVSDVLYLSLEDKQRRVKSRAVRMLSKLRPALSDSVSRRLSVATDWPRQDEGGLKLIELWTRRCAKPGLVIIDVWNRFAPVMQQRNGNAYVHDAAAMAEVKRFAERHNFSILVVHHTRKPGMRDPDDFVNEISGTLGLSGAADGILVLMRARQDVQASLHVTGRDVAEQEIILQFDKESLTWTSLGSKAHHVEGRVQEKVVRFLRSQRPTAYFIKDIAEGVDEKCDSVKKACANLLRNKILRKVGHAFSYPGEAIDPDGMASGEGEV